jgi:hypothetical protein
LYIESQSTFLVVLQSQTLPCHHYHNHSLTST